MATKDDFTEEEWKTLSETPTGLVLWISSIDPGFLARVKESWAAGQAVVKGASTALQKELAKPAKPQFPSNNVEDMKATVLGSLSSSLSILSAKAPDEVGPFKSWIDSIGKAVAEAAGGTTPEEADALAAVQADLDGGAAPVPGAPGAPEAPAAPAAPTPPPNLNLGPDNAGGKF